MHVRHIEQEQKIVELVQVDQRPDDAPPLAEIVESLALLAAVHLGHHQAIKPPDKDKKKPDDEVEPEAGK